MPAETIDLSPGVGINDAATTTVGVTGQTWRASVSAWGSVAPWGGDTAGGSGQFGDEQDREPKSGQNGGQALDWAVAADDRWHLPASEAAVRQRRIAGTPVVETRVRIPDGDAVQRVWAVADRGGLTVIEIENDSPLPFAVAFFGRDVLTERTPTDIPIQGIDLPAGAITLPVAHHTSIRVAIPHAPIPAGLDPHGVGLSGLAGADAVMRGWSGLTDRASRVDLPDVGLADALTAARCDLLLEGPVDAERDPVGFVLDVGELIRCGDEAEPWLFEAVAPLESAARGNDPQLAAAVGAAARIALAAGDTRAAKDIGKMYERVVRRGVQAELGPFSELERGASVGRFVAAVEHRLANGGDLLPMGLPASWLGVNFEMHGVPTSPVSTVSLAVRWHGDRPAVLWEQTGRPLRLTATAADADWTSDAAAGEALWARPRSARSTTLSLSVDPGPTAQLAGQTPAQPSAQQPVQPAVPAPADGGVSPSAAPSVLPGDDDSESTSFS